MPPWSIRHCNYELQYVGGEFPFKRSHRPRTHGPAPMRNEFHPGQRWVSESEPELGLGTILSVTDRRVTAEFAATGEKREYASANAPLRRVRFRVGDTIKNRKEKPFVVQAVTERSGLLFYRCRGLDLCETDLSNAISFNEPEERFFA